MRLGSRGRCGAEGVRDRQVKTSLTLHQGRHSRHVPARDRGTGEDADCGERDGASGSHDLGRTTGDTSSRRKMAQAH